MRREWTDEDAAAVTVGEPLVMESTVRLAEYDPGWAAAYERLRSEISAALGPAVLHIEHVGSTSVPGLAAKPVIDIALVVPDTDDERSYVPALEAIGPRLKIREPEWHRHRVLVMRVEDGDRTSVNLHVFPRGCVEPVRTAAFARWLREHDDDRALYERTKRELAARTWRYMQDYADAKTDVIAEIRARSGADVGDCASCP